MEIDVNLHKPTASNGLELKTISAGIGYNTSNGSNPPVNGVGNGVGVAHNNLHSHLHNNNNNNNNNNNSRHNHRVQNPALHGAGNAEDEAAANNEDNDNRLRCLAAVTSQTTTNTPPTGCCGILTRLLCTSSHTRGKTATSSGDYNTYNNCGPIVHSSLANGNASGLGGNALATSVTANYEHQQQTYMNLWKKNQKTHRRTPQEIYFESRGKSCKKLLKFNGNSNKILLYPEEGWARTASSSYWTITPCWWQPNRCRIEEFAGTQRQVTKAKMLPLEQKGSLLIVGHFRSKNSTATSSSSSSSSASSASAASSACHHANGYSSSSAAAAVSARGASTASTTTTSSTTTLCSPLSSFSSSSSSKDNDEFKLYLSSNISMEDYNMGYCLTGFVERRCQQTNTFQMTHFAVIKRQWPSLAQNNKSTKTTTQNNSSSSSTSCIGSS